MKSKIGIIAVLLGAGILIHGYVVSINERYHKPHEVDQTDVTYPTHDNMSDGAHDGQSKVTNIDFDSKGLLRVGTETYPLEFNNGETLGNILFRMRDAGQIELTGKNFDGLGYFVQTIGDLIPGQGTSLILYINSKVATVGVSTLKPADGDSFEFKIEDNY